MYALSRFFQPKVEAKTNVANSGMPEPVIESAQERLKLLSYLCLRSYDELKPDTYKDLPPGWKLISDYQRDTGEVENRWVRSNYSGRLFGHYNKEGKADEIIVAHRGTNFNEMRDLVTDFKYYCLNILPHYFEYARRWVGYTIDKWEMDDKHDEYKEGYLYKQLPITHTGHSLGALIASAFALPFSNYTDKSQSICFENPGPKKCLEMYLDIPFVRPPNLTIKEALNLAAQHMANYQADVNIINTCNEQLGKIYRLANMPYNYDVNKSGPPPLLQVLGLDNRYYIFEYTIKDQHCIDNIYKYIRNDGAIEIIHNNPVGIQNGYIAYLDTENRFMYWQGYWKFFWDKHPEIHNRYTDFFDYFGECMNTVENVQSLAKKLGTNKIDSTEVQVSQLGMFMKTNDINDIDVNDFVLIEKNNSNVDDDPQKYKSCSVM